MEINDTWRIEALTAFPEAVITIYNRVAKKYLKAPVAILFGWNIQRTGAGSGTYVYIINFKDKRPVKKGWVVLIR